VRYKTLTKQDPYQWRTLISMWSYNRELATSHWLFPWSGDLAVGRVHTVSKTIGSLTWDAPSEYNPGMWDWTSATSEGYIICENWNSPRIYRHVWSTKSSELGKPLYDTMKPVVNRVTIILVSKGSAFVQPPGWKSGTLQVTPNLPAGKLLSFSGTGPFQITLVYSEKLDKSLAEDETNYVTNRKVNKAVLGSDGKTITLTTTGEILAGTSYRLRISNLRNIRTAQIPLEFVDYTLGGGTSLPENKIISNSHKYYLDKNPFTPDHPLHITTPANGPVSHIIVYNMHGNIIRKWNGTSSVSWNARDQSGKLIDSGIYIIKFNVGTEDYMARVIFNK